jgi:proteic killer suppression protein
MDVRFDDEELEKLEVDSTFTAGLAQGLVKAFRKRMQHIRAATDERDFYAMKSLHFEKIKSTPGLHSMRLNDQYRLLVALEGEAKSKSVRIVGIEDYHR